MKIKKFSDIDAVVCGYLGGEGSRRDYFGSLILGVYDKGKLRHIGQVGTGLDKNTMKRLFNILNSMKTDRSPFETIPELKRRAFWCRPETVVRIGYHEWTKDNRLRVPVFKGIRDDKGPEDCTME